MYQQKPQWTVYVKYRNMAVVIVKDRGFDMRNATDNQHHDGVMCRRCSLMPCPKIVLFGTLTQLK